MSCILSFIIPSYNAEPYLDKAIRSMLCESCLNEIEILVIDDGSTDHTANIACQYAERYPHTVRIIRKANGGHGSAINVGARQAQGLYFKVVDADDWVITENLPELIENLKSSQADVVLTPYHRVNVKDGSRESWRMYIESYGRIYTLADIVSHWKDFYRCCMFHGITYQTEFYRAYNHYLPEKIFFEDHEFSSIPFCHARTILPLNLYIYQYMVGNSTQSVSDESRVKRLDHSKQVTYDLLTYLSGHPELEDVGKEYLRQMILSGIPSYYEAACILQKSKKKGRAQLRQFNQMLLSLAPELFRRVRIKAGIFQFLSYTHLTPEMYRHLRQMRFYHFLRKLHPPEKIEETS